MEADNLAEIRMLQQEASKPEVRHIPELLTLELNIHFYI